METGSPGMFDCTGQFTRLQAGPENKKAFPQGKARMICIRRDYSATTSNSTSVLLPLPKSMVAL